MASARGRDPSQVFSSGETAPSVLSWAHSREQMLTYRKEYSGRPPVMAGTQGTCRKWSSMRLFSLVRRWERGDQTMVTAWWEGTSSVQGCTAAG